MQPVCYQEMFFLEILKLKDRNDWLSQNIRMKLPLYAVYNPRSEQVSKHVQFQWVLPSGECQMVEYKFVLWYYLRKYYKMIKWEHQLDATIKYIFHLKLVSTCFGRDIAHHQEITQLYISAYGNRPCNEEKLT